MGLVEGRFPPGAKGPPAHKDGHDELFLVLEGKVRFQIEQEISQAVPGTTIFSPEGTLHTFKPEDDGPTRIVGAFLPGGYERYFEAIAALPDSTAPSSEVLAELAARFGTEYVGPAVWDR